MNDSRLCAAVALTAAANGAAVLNHTEVTGLQKDNGRVVGVLARDRLTGEEFAIRARAVVNATGPFTDAILRMDNPQETVRVRCVALVLAENGRFAHGRGFSTADVRSCFFCA